MCVFIRVYVYLALDLQLTIPSSTGKSITENSTELNGNDINSIKPSTAVNGLGSKGEEVSLS
jgi:hypothetical protein